MATPIQDAFGRDRLAVPGSKPETPGAGLNTVPVHLVRVPPAVSESDTPEVAFTGADPKNFDQGPRYKHPSPKGRAAHKAKLGRSDKLDLREELAVLQALLEEKLSSEETDIQAVLELTKEIRTTTKAIVDIEVAMRKAWPTERVKRTVEAIMGVVRKHSTPAQLAAIGADLQALKARGL